MTCTPMHTFQPTHANRLTSSIAKRTVLTTLSALTLATSPLWAAPAAPANSVVQATSVSTPASPATETFSHGYFDNAVIFRPEGKPRAVALVISDGQGWTQQDTQIAESLRRQGILAAGLDVKKMTAAMRADDSECLASQGDFDNFSRVLQARYQLDGYRLPVVVGNGAVGSALAYAAVATAPQGTFGGAISLGFAPQAVPFSMKLCKDQLVVAKPAQSAASTTQTADKTGKNNQHSSRNLHAHRVYRYDFQPATTQLNAPWLVFGATNSASTTALTDLAAFVKATPNATLIPVAAPSPASGTPNNTTGMQAIDTQLNEAFARLRPHQQVTAAPPAAVSDLPLVEAPATAPVQSHDMLAIMISGDGGWAGIDKDLATAMNRAGIPVIGFDSLRYFWKARTPDSTVKDVERVIRYYQTQPAWKRSRILLIGYSQGADVMPFVLNRLSPDVRNQVAEAILIGLGEKASFEFHVTNWIKSNDSGIPILPETQKLPAGLAVCAYGVEDTDTICPKFTKTGSPVRALALKGGHHFDGNYDKLADVLLKTVPGTTPPTTGAGQPATAAKAVKGS